MKNLKLWGLLVLLLSLVGVTPAVAASDGYADKFVRRVTLNGLQPARGKMHGNVSWDPIFNAHVFHKGGEIGQAAKDHIVSSQADGSVPEKVSVPPGTKTTNLYVRYTGGNTAEIWACVNNAHGTFTVPSNPPRYLACYGGEWFSIGTCANLFRWTPPKKPEPVPPPVPPVIRKGKLVVVKTIVAFTEGKQVPFPTGYEWPLTTTPVDNRPIRAIIGDLERQDSNGSWKPLYPVMIQRGERPDEGRTELLDMPYGTYRIRERAAKGLVTEVGEDQVTLDSDCAELRLCNSLTICPPAPVPPPPPAPPAPPAPVVTRKRVFVPEAEHPYALPTPSVEYRQRTNATFFGGVAGGGSSRQKVFRNRGRGHTQRVPPGPVPHGGGKTGDTDGDGNNGSGDPPPGR